LDKTGLHIAHPNATAAEIAPYGLDRGGFKNRLGLSPQVTFEIDADGIMPIMGSACAFADDAATLVKSFVEKVWGENSLTQNINFINDALGETLETYLTNPLKFWKHHTRMYKKRPIYWLFASSQKGKPAFQVLTYLHRMDKYTVQKIRTNYLHPHQAYLSEQLELLKRDNNDPKTVDVLLQQIAECRSYDETLKSLDNQQIDMDLDDGVLENYGLFGVGVRKV
jgi:type II restriction/modification system DNA methylase subunit YeeA